MKVPTAFIEINRITADRQETEFVRGLAWDTNELTHKVFEHAREHYGVQFEQAEYLVDLYSEPNELVETFLIAEHGYRSLTTNKSTFDMAPDEYMRMQREQHQAIIIDKIGREASCLLDVEGVYVPSMIAGLVRVAKQIADKHASMVGDDFFEACLWDVLDGGNGLHVGKRYAKKSKLKRYRNE